MKEASLLEVRWSGETRGAIVFGTHVEPRCTDDSQTREAGVKQGVVVCSDE